MDRFRAWPPRPGLLITLAPEYIRGIDFNNQENWNIEEWRSYARYLEEKGQQFIDDLKRERDIARVALVIKGQKASRKSKKTKAREAIVQVLLNQKIQAGGLGAVAILHGQPNESAGQGDDAFKIALQFVVSRGGRSEML